MTSILYNAGGKVYIAGRSPTNAEKAIEQIKTSNKDSTGGLAFLELDVSDLSKHKKAAETFLSKETRLDVLFNNAAVSLPPAGTVSAQGIEITIATNTLGPYLFTQHLLPIFKSTAKSSPPASVRVVWTGSVVVDLSAPKDGITVDNFTSPSTNPQDIYAVTKTANWYLAAALARQLEGTNVLSIVQNPGNLRTNLLRHHEWMNYLVFPLLYSPRYGAYTELWAGLSQDLTLQDNGGYIIPWGRKHPSPREDLVRAIKIREDGGNGSAEAFEKWCEETTREFR